ARPACSSASAAVPRTRHASRWASTHRWPRRWRTLRRPGATTWTSPAAATCTSSPTAAWAGPATSSRRSPAARTPSGWAPPRPGRLGPAERSASLAAMAGETFDVIIIGGGVVGAGAALDAATRGLSVALLEARDWASGTSSRSSKLVHGGLRYLEMLDFPLV